MLLLKVDKVINLSFIPSLASDRIYRLKFIIMKKSIFIFSLLFLFSAFVLVPAAWANCNCICTDGARPGAVSTPNDCTIACGQQTDATGNSVNMQSCNEGTGTSGSSSGSSGSISIKDPLGINNQGPEELYTRLIKALLAFVGVASLITFVYAGFIFLISAGSPERVKKAKDTMLYAVLGIAISMASYAILSFIFKTLETATQ